MDLTAVTITELRYLVAVAENGHFGRAAAQCFVTQPTLSAQLKKLENNLGVRLIERGGRRAQLTPAGQRVVERARVILEQLRGIGDTARGHSDPLEGELRLGVIPTLGPYLLPLLLRPLQRAFPKLHLVVVEQVTATLLEQLAGHRLDTALIALPIDAPSLDTMHLFDEPFWVLTPREHRLAKRLRVKESELREQSVLLLAEGHCLRDQALAICGEQASGFADFRATSLETLGHLVAAGLGCTLLPALAVSHVRSPAVVALPFAQPVPGRRIGLAWRHTFPLPDALRMFGEFVRKQALAKLARTGSASSSGRSVLR
jgi:LysR family hydrogen peroxide-inducible transcriptional activator